MSHYDARLLRMRLRPSILEDYRQHCSALRWHASSARGEGAGARRSTASDHTAPPGHRAQG
eukprot:scaffold108519_cov78-Phaeocystis_antarctica.AAC.8